MVTATSGASAESPNPYQSPEMAMLKAKLKRLPAFLTGVIGLAIGAGFYGVLCGFLVVALLMHAPNTPGWRERIFMIGAAVFHGIPLVLWIAQRRNLYRLRPLYLWILGIVCWLLIPLSATIMILSLGM
jgi:hypothetical protein